MKNILKESVIRVAKQFETFLSKATEETFYKFGQVQDLLHWQSTVMDVCDYSSETDEQAGVSFCRTQQSNMHWISMDPHFWMPSSNTLALTFLCLFLCVMKVFCLLNAGGAACSCANFSEGRHLQQPLDGSHSHNLPTHQLQGEVQCLLPQTHLTEDTEDGSIGGVSWYLVPRFEETARFLMSHFKLFVDNLGHHIDYSLDLVWLPLRLLQLRQSACTSLPVQLDRAVALSCMEGRSSTTLRVVFETRHTKRCRSPPRGGRLYQVVRFWT